MEIPDEALVPGIYGYLLLLIAGYFSQDFRDFFFDLPTYIWGYREFFFDHLKAAWILYTFLYIQIWIPAVWQLMRKYRYREILELSVSYLTFPISLSYLWLQQKAPQKESDDIVTWVWWGDLRIALFLWLTLGVLHGVTAFMIAYIAGSIFSILFLIFSKTRTSQIAFGPFLALGWMVVIVWHGEILDLAQAYLSHI
jgi:prepilin signal peptidase PulO-like enzyme (type II secretory pathway)